MKSLGWSVWSRQSSGPPFGKRFRMLHAAVGPERSPQRKCVESSRWPVSRQEIQVDRSVSGLAKNSGTK